MRYECPVCGATFGSMVELSKHLEQHKGAIYRCPSCGKAYASLEEMNNCLKRHIEQENARAKEKEKERKAIAADYKELCGNINALIEAFNKAHRDICTLTLDINATTSDKALGQELINIEHSYTRVHIPIKRVENKKETNNKKDATSFERFLREILNEAYGFED